MDASRPDELHLTEELAVPGLPRGAVLAVCAHPDDESFGLGALITRLTDAGIEVGVLCFTHGEASTLAAVPGQLAAVRAEELAAAASRLGVRRAVLLDYADGALAEVDRDELAGHVRREAELLGAMTMLVFDTGGITGHPDHRAATAAALAAAEMTDRSVLAWAVPDDVARRLEDELGAGFVGRSPAEIDAVVRVDRCRQRAAIAAHLSQSADNPVLVRRLELLGDREALRWLRRHTAQQPQITRSS